MGAAATKMRIAGGTGRRQAQSSSQAAVIRTNAVTRAEKKLTSAPSRNGHISG